MSESAAVQNATIKVYKCPSCGGAVKYSASTGELTCAWCANTYDAASLEVKEVSTQLEGYQCPECGAQLMSDNFIAADTCPYCGNNEIAPQRFEGAFEPDYIIPFTVSKKKAIDCYEAALREKDYLPDDYIAEDRIVSILGTYVPFWLVDGVLDFDYTYKTVKHRSKQSDLVKYHHRVGTYDVVRLPADGSERMADDMMDSIEPYDYSALLPFTTDYLPGFVAERYTVESDDVLGRLANRVARSAAVEATKTVTYDFSERTLEQDRFHAYLHQNKVEQVLLPVWLIVVSYRDEKYLIGVNGQTGKVAVNLPLDQKKQAKKARELAVKRSWWFALLMFSPAIISFIYGWNKNGHETLVTPFIEWANGTYSDDGTLNAAILILVLIFVGLGASLWYGRHSFLEAKEEVRKTMQNVEESRDASVFGTMTITLSELGKGPLSEPAES